jgi:aminoglycoside phosphotransferase (APT) family kinase protein
VNTAQEVDLASHEKVVGYLRQLRFDPHGLMRVHVVGEGISGSEKFLLSFPGHDVFLKVAKRPHGTPGWSRAWREFAFYRDLANKVPLWLPYLLASRVDEDSILMLFVAYEARPAQQWEYRDWLDVVRQLAQLHAAYYGLAAVEGLEWLPPNAAPVTTRAIREATVQWKLLSEREDLDSVFSPAARGWIPGLLHAAPVIAVPLDSVNLTLCHGDFHAGNLLRDSEGHWLFADWQEVRFGSGLQDLSFLCERALTTGAEIPRHDILMTYHDELQKRVDAAPGAAQLHLAWDRTELLSYLLVWPSFLRQAAAREVETVVWRMRELTRTVNFH